MRVGLLVHGLTNAILTNHGVRKTLQLRSSLFDIDSILCYLYLLFVSRLTFRTVNGFYKLASK